MGEKRLSKKETKKKRTGRALGVDNREIIPRHPSVLPDSGDDDFLETSFGKQERAGASLGSGVNEQVVNPRWAERMEAASKMGE